MSVEQDIEILLSYAGNCNYHIPINETLQTYTLSCLTDLPDITYWILISCAAAISTVFKGELCWMQSKKTSRNLWCFPYFEILNTPLVLNMYFVVGLQIYDIESTLPTRYWGYVWKWVEERFSEDEQNP